MPRLYCLALTDSFRPIVFLPKTSWGDAIRRALNNFWKSVFPGKSTGDWQVSEDELAAAPLEAELGSIAARVRAGDAQAEQLLLMRLLPGLSALCRHYFGQGAAASDARQQALLILLGKLRNDDLRDLTKIPAFLRGVVINLSREAIREHNITRNNQLEAIFETLSTTHSSCAALVLEREELRTMVKRCLHELPQARDRQVLYRSFYLEQDRATVCRELGIDESGFDRIVSRAKLRLRALIALQLGRKLEGYHHE